MNKTTVDYEEIAKFSALAEKWWDEEGECKPLHLLNPLRIEYIKEKIQKHFNVKEDFSKISLIDIGCGGGLLSEPLANIGIEVTAIDASEENIKTAKQHADNNNVTVNYICTTAEELAKKKNLYDVVIAMEIVEHVSDLNLFIVNCLKLLKPDGILIISTINRTLKSYLGAILGAEYIFRWLPKGTHSWNKFLKPSEIAQICEKHNGKLQEIVGVSYNLLKKKFYISKNIEINYMLLFNKKIDD